VYLPLVSVTVPVGAGLPDPPLIVTVTCSGCVVVMLDEPGVAAIVGVALLTVTEPELPVALWYVEELLESGV
jgi:hypothetical protein